MTTKLTVLVAGATGMLGSKIVSALLDKGNIDVRAMVRSIDDSNGENRKKIQYPLLLKHPFRRFRQFPDRIIVVTVNNICF